MKKKSIKKLFEVDSVNNDAPKISQTGSPQISKSIRKDKVEKAMNFVGNLDLSEYEFAELALLCLDQFGVDGKMQSKIRQMLGMKMSSSDLAIGDIGD